MMVQAKTHAALKITLNFVSQPWIFKSAFYLKRLHLLQTIVN